MTTTTDEDKTGKGGKGMRPVLLIPLFIFVALAAVFLMRLVGDNNPDAIPSALIGRPAPDFDLAPLEGSGQPALSRSDLDGKVSVVNVFASWCGPCRIEHPQLMELAKDDRFQLVGINYKDAPANAIAFLDELGDPYDAIGVDPRGRTGIDWGVYGIPETFIVGRDGTILYKQIGPIGPQGLEETIRPEIEKALAAADSTAD